MSFVLLVFYASLLAWLSLMPGSGSAPLFPHDDKVMHLAAYFVFALLGMPLMRSRSAIVGITLAVILFGALMEFGQYFVPLRDMSVWDVFANSLGACLGAHVSWRLRDRLSASIYRNTSRT